MKNKIKWSSYAKPYLPYFIFGPLCMIVEVIGEILMPIFLAMILNNAASEGIGFSAGMAGLMVLTAVLMMLGGIGGAYFGAKASVNYAADLRADIYKKVQGFSFTNIDKYQTGSLVTRLTNDVTQIQNMINMLLRMCLRSPGMMIGALIMAISLRPSLAAVLAVTMPLMLIAIFFVIRIGFPRFGAMQKKIDALNSTVQENITNMRVVKSFVREETEKEKFKKANEELKKGGIAAMSVMIFLSPVMTLFMNITIVAVLWFGSDMVLNLGMPIGDLSAFTTYVTQILFSLMMVTMMLMGFSRALASAKRIKEVLCEPIDLSDENAMQRELRVKNGEIEFKNVSFRYYKDSEEKVLDGINLKIEAGSTVGISG